jgi:hypothetical protein
MTKAHMYRRDLKKIGVKTKIHQKKGIRTRTFGMMNAFQVDMTFVDKTDKAYTWTAYDMKTTHKAVEKCLKGLWSQVPGKRRPELPPNLRHI